MIDFNLTFFVLSLPSGDASDSDYAIDQYVHEFDDNNKHNEQFDGDQSA